MNSGILRPLEDLDLFEYSNLNDKAGSTFETGMRNSNLGQKTIKHKSNIELNQKKDDKAKARQPNEEQLSDEVTQMQDEEESTSRFTSSSPSKKIPLSRGSINIGSNTLQITYIPSHRSIRTG